MKRLIRPFTKIVLMAFVAGILFSANPGTDGRDAGLVTVPAAYAAEPAAAGGGATTDSAGKKNEDPNKGLDIKEISKKILQTSTLVNTAFNPLIHFFVFQIGNFLGNDYIYGGGMGEMLKNIWVVSRNIVNIVFALLLLVIAFMNVVHPSNESNFAIKKLLPKFVLLLIAVNFSWLGTKVVLDAANVATNVVFQIPASVARPSEKVLKIQERKCKVENDKYSGACVPSQIYFPFDAEQTKHFSAEKCPPKERIANAYPTIRYENGQKIEEPAKDQGSPFHGYRIFCWQTMDLSQYNQNNASIFLSHGLIKIQSLPSAGDDQRFSSLFVGTLFSLVIQIVYLVAFLVLWIALVIRVAVLWLLVSFSPFFVLAWFLKDFQVNLPEQFSFNFFLEYAFVPAKVGAVFSVGFLMIASGQALTDGFFENAMNAKNVEISTAMFSVNSLFSKMDTVQEFIWLLMVILIVWVGTFAALSKTQIIKSVVAPFEEYGKSIGKWVARAPKWVPIIPLPTKQGGTRMVGLQKFDVARKLRELEDQFAPGTANVWRYKKATDKLRQDEGLRRTIYDLAGRNDHKAVVAKIQGELKLDREDLKEEGKLEGMLKEANYTPEQVKLIKSSVRYGLGLSAATDTKTERAAEETQAETQASPSQRPAGTQAGAGASGSTADAAAQASAAQQQAQPSGAPTLPTGTPGDAGGGSAPAGGGSTPGRTP